MPGLQPQNIEPSALPAGDPSPGDKYQERLRNELLHADAIIEAKTTSVESEVYLPRVPAFGFAMEIYARYLSSRMPRYDLDAYVLRRQESTAQSLRMLSLGCGMGEAEIRLVAESGCRLDLTLVDLNPVLLAKGRELVEKEHLTIKTKVCDVNAVDIPCKAFDLIVCRSSLHHFLNLEHIFKQIKQGLSEDGEFLVIGEWIGRNGLMLYPETQVATQKIFDCLPPQLRRNTYTGQIDNVVPNIDNSAESFEAIRSEEILPLLLANFTPVEYVTYDAFVSLLLDFRYGPNYDLSKEHDRAVVSFITHRDIEFIREQELKPTSMFGIFR